MKQPERLIRTGSPAARALLSTLDEDVPPDLAGAQAQTLRALGVAKGSSGAAPDPSVSPRRTMPLVSVAGLSLVSLLVFAVSYDRSAVSPSNSVHGYANAVTTTAPPANSAEDPAIAAAPRGTDVHALASVPAENRVGSKNVRPSAFAARREPGNPTAPSLNVASPSGEPAGNVTDELQLLERAQAAASRGRGDEALALVALHQRDFPRGRFSVEMSVVEIEALASSGRIEQAAARGQQFLESHPGSPYTRRVEAVVRLRDQKEQAR